MPGQHSEGYQAGYQLARSRAASWVREHVPTAWLAARTDGGPVDHDAVVWELRLLADAIEAGAIGLPGQGPD